MHNYGTPKVFFFFFFFFFFFSIFILPVSYTFPRPGLHRLLWRRSEAAEARRAQREGSAEQLRKRAGTLDSCRCFPIALLAFLCLVCLFVCLCFSSGFRLHKLEFGAWMLTLKTELLVDLGLAITMVATLRTSQP